MMVEPVEERVKPIVYVGMAKDKVAEFDALKTHLEKVGYWDKTNDGDLKEVKSIIKNHCLLAQDYRCPYCRQRIVVDHNAAWDAEHIIPKDSHPQFMFVPQNLCVTCKDCNNNKSNKKVLVNQARKTFPTESEDYIMYHPYFDDYAKHITIVAEAGYYLPRTDKGRLLVEICGLLRFLFKFANFESSDISIKVKMADLQRKLMETNDPMVENFIYGCIGKLVEEGQRKSQQLGLQKLLA